MACYLIICDFYKIIHICNYRVTIHTRTTISHLNEVACFCNESWSFAQNKCADIVVKNGMWSLNRDSAVRSLGTRFSQALTASRVLFVVRL